jgi:hypothetical protein
LRVGAGVLLAAPILFPARGRSLRPAAKRVVRGYLARREKAKEMSAETREQLSDLVAEAKAESQTHPTQGFDEEQTLPLAVSFRRSEYPLQYPGTALSDWRPRR